MKDFRNKNIKDLCESYEKQYNIRKERKEREELLATVYRYFYDCKNKMKEKDYIDAHISGISVKEDEACGASFYYKTGFYDVYCDYHNNICSIYVYTSDYKEIKIKGSIELNSYKNMFIDVSINENNYKAILYMLNEYIESITTTISSGGTVTCDENILIMNTEKLLEMFFKNLLISIKNNIEYNYTVDLKNKTKEICEVSVDINDIADNAFELTITNKNNSNKLTSVTISVDVQLNFTIEGWTLTSIPPYSSSKKINKKGTQEDIIGKIEYIFTSVEMYLKENHKKEINNMMTFDKIKELVEDFCKKLNGKYVGVNAIINNCLSDNHICLYVYYTNNSENTTRCIAKIDILVNIYDMVRINGCIFYGKHNQHSCKYDTVCTDLQTAYAKLLDVFLKIETRIKKEINDNNKREIDKINKYFNNQDEKENDDMKKEDMKELMKLALNLKHGLINCCDGYFKDHLNVQIVSINTIGDFIVKVSGLNIILDDESTNVVAEIKVESTQNEGIYYIKNDHLAGNGFGTSKVICSNENKLPIIKDELKNSFDRIKEFLMYIKEEEDKLSNKKLKDQYNAIIETVNSIKDKLFIQLLNYDLSKSIKFDILDLGKDNSVRFLITADFTHLTIADVNITMNGLNDIDIVGAFINENEEIDTEYEFHCNSIEELRNELDNIIVNIASTIGKVREYMYNIEFGQIKGFVWNLNNKILKDEEFKIETIYHNYKDMFKIEFLINSQNKNNFIVVEETIDYKFLIKYELFGLSSFKQFTKSDEINNYIQTLYEKIKHVVKSLG